MALIALKSASRRPLTLLLTAFILYAVSPLTVQADGLTFSEPHGLYDVPSLSVALQSQQADATIYYTTDGSTPTTRSLHYTQPLQLSKTTIVRAIEVVGDSVSPVATSSYIFNKSVLGQSNTPTGYPTEWGEYTQIWGTAQADYEMDSEMTGDATLRAKISDGLRQLPILSLVSDKDNFFSHECDSVTGGIYIFTGPPVGDGTGHGWTRPASIELFGPTSNTQHDLSVTCGVRLHGGHGRLAEKNPKHSFRLVFKEKYGPKTLQYPLFGEDEPQKFDQLVLRCHFGNTWQHWAENNRQIAQYTRDVWARRMQRKMGHTAVNALYVHLFLNGMYWGIYNIAERVDDQFGKDHLGGKKSDIDVIKIEEDGGNHLEAAEGDMEAWSLMVETAKQVAGSAVGNEAYCRLQGLNPEGVRDSTLEPLLDIDGFIDYILINQFGGNTDWDHHNWYALRRRGPESQGFRFLCWDTECIFVNESENVLNKNNGSKYPTGIFQNLLQNPQFARRYLHRAKEVLASDGPLGQASVVAVWDSLYNTISTALYDEAARWGDYRRDVHRWQSAGQLYSVDEHYMAERQRLLNNYFPMRSGRVLNQITEYVNIDDFELPDGWQPLLATMFYEWNGTGADAQPLDNPTDAQLILNSTVNGGNVVAGISSVSYKCFADLSQYDHIVLRGTGNRIRLLANRLVNHGPYKQIIVSLNEDDPYWDSSVGGVSLPLADFMTVPTNEGVARTDDFVHLNAIKVESGSSARLSGIYLVGDHGAAPVLPIETDMADRQTQYYNLSGLRVSSPQRGIYIRRTADSQQSRKFTVHY